MMSNSIKRYRLRVKDIKAGVKAYIAHPVYGISEVVFTSKPYMYEGIGLFASCIQIYNDWVCEDKRSMSDAGITEGDSRNGRRAFKKRKQAEAWMRKWAKDKNFIKAHSIHEAMCEDMREIEEDYLNETYW